LLISCQVYNHNHKSYEKKLMDFTGDEGFDVIIEHLANINLAHDIQMIKKSKLIEMMLSGATTLSTGNTDGGKGSVQLTPSLRWLVL